MNKTQIEAKETILSTNVIKLNQQNQSDIENNKQPENKKQPDDKKYDEICIQICANIFIAFAIILFLGVLYAFPIAEFVMAEKYRSEMTCDSFLSPYLWMIIEGVVDLIINSLTGVSFVIKHMISETVADEFKIVTYLPMFISNTFKFAWIICGAVMFWRDCPHLETKSMNDFYWTVLIINLVSIWFVYKTMLAKKK